MIEAEQTSPAKNLKKEKYFEIKIPAISLKNINTNVCLVIALVIFAFTCGYLTDKVIYLSNALNNKTANTSAPTQTNTKTTGLKTTQPEEPTLPPAKVDVAQGHLPPLGNTDAKVTIVEFSDFQCPFCKQFEDNTYPKLYDEYIKTNKIKFVFRHYPLIGIHPNAQKAAEASECANEQGKFWDYHDMLFKNQSTWSPLPLADAINSFTDYAAQLGLNTTTFRSCLDTDQLAQKVKEDSDDGDKAYVNGTPSFFINGKRLVGAQPFTQIQQLIEQELK
jgi:protein-disulfide isomerase